MQSCLSILGRHPFSQEPRPDVWRPLIYRLHFIAQRFSLKWKAHVASPYYPQAKSILVKIHDQTLKVIIRADGDETPPKTVAWLIEEIVRLYSSDSVTGTNR
jgi:hypothetical protein